MDPITIGLISGGIGALPGLIGMGQEGPRAPAYVRPDIDKYMSGRETELAGLRESAFNPQSELYAIAGERARAAMNQELARRGLYDSSYGNAALSELESELSRKFLENEFQRRLQATQQLTGYDMDRARIEAGLAGQQNQMAMNAYEAAVADMQRKNANLGSVFGGLGSGLSAYSGARATQDANARADKQWSDWMGLQEAKSGVSYPLAPAPGQGKPPYIGAPIELPPMYG